MEEKVPVPTPLTEQSHAHLPDPMPTIGRIVHYYDPGEGESPIAAVVTKVWSQGVVNLRPFVDAVPEHVPPRSQWVQSVPFSAEPAPHTWRYPPRV